MQTKELARRLGVIFSEELAEFLVNPEIGVRQIEREYTRSLMAEFAAPGKVEDLFPILFSHEFSHYCPAR